MVRGAAVAVVAVVVAQEKPAKGRVGEAGWHVTGVDSTAVDAGNRGRGCLDRYLDRDDSTAASGVVSGGSGGFALARGAGRVFSPPRLLQLSAVPRPERLDRSLRCRLRWLYRGTGVAP